MSADPGSYLGGPAFGFLPNAPDDGPDELTGERVGEFIVGRKIGAGGMGVVYEAQQIHPHRTVALKLIRPGIFSKKAQRRFEIEREVLGRLQHPGIAQIHHAGTAKTKTGERPFFAMELVSGRQLFDYADTENLSVRERLELFTRICDSVQYAHTKGVIHRDLKPDNILVDQSGQSKILDFGVARAIDLDSQITTQNTDIRQLVGTLSYMSPEQVTGNLNDIDARSDVYSLGIVSYGLLTGRLPYDVSDKSIPEAARIICEQDAKPLSTSHKHLRGDVDAIISKALEKDPQRRYQTALDLAADIRRFLDHRPVIARPPSAMYQVRKYAQRHKGLFCASAAALLLLILGIIGTSVGLWKATQSEREAVLAQQVAQNNLVLAEEREQEADSAREQLKTIVEFQSSMLSDIDVKMMGRNVLSNLRERTLEGLVAKRASQAQIDAVQASFDELNPADIARQIVDEEILARAVETLEKEYADLPLLEAAMRQAIGDTYGELGLYTQSLPQLEKALVIRRKELGVNNLDTLHSIQNMGVLLRMMGKRAEALPYVREALEGKRRILGNDHPDTLGSIDNMGWLLILMSKYEEALPYCREALEGRRRVLSDDDPKTLRSINNMGFLLHSLGKFGEALSYYREALEGRRRTLGDDHKATVQSMHSIGSLLESMGKYEEALPYYREALEVGQRVQGTDHQGTLTSIDAMGKLFNAMGKYAKALPYCREAVEARRRVLGDDHPSTLMSMNTLGQVLVGMGKNAEGINYLRKSLEAGRRLQSDDHVSTLVAIHNLGASLQEMGELEEAEALGAEAVAGFRKSLPEGHLLTDASLRTYGKTLTLLKRYQKAEKALVEAQTISEGQVGMAHPRTVESMQYLLDLYTVWHETEPQSGYEIKARHWRAKLPTAHDEP